MIQENNFNRRIICMGLTISILYTKNCVSMFVHSNRVIKEDSVKITTIDLHKLISLSSFYVIMPKKGIKSIVKSSKMGSDTSEVLMVKIINLNIQVFKATNLKL